MTRIFKADAIDAALERELTLRDQMNTPEMVARLRARANRRKAMTKMIEAGRDKANETHRRKAGNAVARPKAGSKAE